MESNIWPSLALLGILCIPALRWLLRWLRSSHGLLKEGQSLSSLKCQSCSSKGNCASHEQQSKCHTVEDLLAKFPQDAKEPKP